MNSYLEWGSFIQRNWVKLVVILLAFNIVLSKNIQFDMKLSSIDMVTNSNETNSLYNFTHTEKSLIENENNHLNPSVPQSVNTFSNLGFILNPNYKHKNKVSNKIILSHDEKCKLYVKKHSNLAISEMNEYGIPASIKLAQALLESNVGESKLALANNNHFGIKCFSRKCKKGHCSNFSDDSHKDFFRKYDSVKKGYRAHSLFLQKDRYIHLKAYGTRDYQSWAEGLMKAGYATDKLYSKKLIRIIEALELYKYDE